MSRITEGRLDRRYLRKVELLHEKIDAPGVYPFNLPAVRELEKIEFHERVTYMVGENGVGKSTLLEAIAAAWGFNPEGGTLNFNFATAETHSSLHRYIRLIRGTARPKDGFFFRAESYYNVATTIDELDKDPCGGKIIDSYGGRSLHEQSHGEAFFATFMHRFGAGGLYILDEPEAALSPVRQLAMLTRIHELARSGGQFIISTHSPLLMAYPHSRLYSLTANGIRECRVEETEHYIITREFLNNRESMLEALLEEDEEEQ
ncbi:AAA family ATPase [Saccharibacillus kuerlensis]|uniref:ABC transporter ATP-binding protein n=1 Tax=Saccharibacillus kuerlensis TaxID=459527 RepID=A0ABQ2L6J6_9BACL|nr:AAA family ATPase [Saccharibacillus kuerlensis]GGO05132.1 ABC transporter ATP-binding protein [Saccharibacillus kuerlensis]